MQPIKRFLFENFIREGEAFHIARVTIYSRKDLSLHTHDFAEVFWVESGNGIHWINNQKVKLAPGHLVMIRPHDQHTLTSLEKEGITILNLAFSEESLAHLRNRYFSNSDSYFWTPSDLPFHSVNDINLIRRISRRAEESLKFNRNNLYLDSILLFIFRSITENNDIKLNNQVPAWLNNALHEFTTPDLFKKGASGFASLCGKNIDYVNRTIRRTYNKTLSNFVNELRMNFAARQLIITNVPIKTISSDCGFNNLGHFYKTFKECYHQTPTEFRRNNQTVA